MWVRLIRDLRFVPPGRDNRRFSIYYREGMTLSVKRAWGASLIASGDAVEVPTPPRS